MAEPREVVRKTMHSAKGPWRFLYPLDSIRQERGTLLALHGIYIQHAADCTQAASIDVPLLLYPTF